MSALKETFGKFHSAMLDNNAAAVISTVRPNPRIAPEKQLAIYIEGYRIRLVQAIRSDYPALAELLGKEFDRLALLYIERYPPTHFNLDRYPHRFADLVRMHQQDALAADLAVLEGAIAEVFMLPESQALLPDDLAGITAEKFADLILKPRAASRQLTLYYPAEAYLVGQREGREQRRPEPKKTYLFLVRHQNEVKRYSLSKAEHTLLTRLCEGFPVGMALDSAASQEAGLAEEMAANLQRWFTRWVENGFFRMEGK